jgi:chromate transporter
MDSHQPAGESATPRPHSKTELFLVFTSIALQGFGGVLTIIQREIVEKRRWLTPQEFTEDWAVSQVMPGGNVINLSIIMGNRYFGWQGAVVALAGMLTAPLILVLIVATLYNQFIHVPQVAGAVRGMGAVAAGLIAAASIKMLTGLKQNPLSAHIKWALIAITFIAIGILRIPLLWTVLGLGLPAFAYAWWLLGQQDREPRA